MKCFIKFDKLFLNMALFNQVERGRAGRGLKNEKEPFFIRFWNFFV